MRSLVTLSLGVIAAIVLSACTGDQPATTAPTMTPSFMKISADKQYQFSLSCSANVSPTSSFLDSSVYHSDPPDVGNATAVDLLCGGSTVVGNVHSFDYDIEVRDLASNTTVARCQTQRDGVSYTINRTGTFTCRYETWSASLTVAES
jgi:hypothetical protein